MATPRKLRLVAGPLLAAAMLSGCVSQSSYDALQAQNQQLQQQNAALTSQVAANKEQIARLVGAIKYTANSDLLFASGGWEMRPQGQRIIAGLAKNLAPTQQAHLLVNGFTDNAPIGPALAARGVTSNEQLSQKRADSVMAFLISQGVSPDLISAHGYGEQNPVAPNDTAAGRAKNRRVELTLAPPS